MTDSVVYADVHNRSPHWIGPRPTRPETILDSHGVFLIDPDGNFLGFDGNWGEGGPLGRLLYASRSSTRNL